MDHLERLDYILMKQRQILDSMMHIKMCIKTNREFQVVNLPGDWTPNELIRHYIDLYNILDEAKKHPKHILHSWLEKAQDRKTDDFTTKREIGILKELTQ